MNPGSKQPESAGLPAARQITDEELHEHPQADPLAPAAALPGIDVTAIDSPDAETARYALALGDDALILAQRLGELVSRAPELEEDVALANIGLDNLGQARALLQYAGRSDSRSEDELAYFRDEAEFTSSHLVEQPNGDFAEVIARLLLVALYQRELFGQLVNSTDPFLAAVAAKAIKEVRYHLEHAATWTIRLGDGTDESHDRMQAALASRWPYLDELFSNAPFEELIDRGVAVDIAARRGSFDSALAAVLEEAALERPEAPAAMARGRWGQHSQHLGYILAEMQVLGRAHPGATW
ncbi:phenylacetate-CoA oxygenase subunit PaaC [Saxibacter everestensis]|uniref:Phenylacetate-CoA oxygenase subunit PaaC n=1 Tax=Saxibacter everestensis TaxID=2909229 RepID=A0ABY8QS61_9MICO|nr:phenylacetate-CoA oxygenase subunit PaaC [Brevibacteriaceae bacterium ZFBP1038]